MVVQFSFFRFLIGLNSQTDNQVKEIDQKQSQIFCLNYHLFILVKKSTSKESWIIYINKKQSYFQAIKEKAILKELKYQIIKHADKEEEIIKEDHFGKKQGVHEMSKKIIDYQLILINLLQGYIFFSRLLIIIIRKKKAISIRNNTKAKKKTNTAIKRNYYFYKTNNQQEEKIIRISHSMLLESFKFEPLNHCGYNNTSKIFRIYNSHTQENVNLVMKTSQHTSDISPVSPFYSPYSSHQQESLQNQNIQVGQDNLQAKQSRVKNNTKKTSKGSKKGLTQQCNSSLSNDLDNKLDNHCNFHCHMIHKEWKLLESILPHPNIIQVYKVFQNVDCFYTQSKPNPEQNSSDSSSTQLNIQSEQSIQEQAQNSSQQVPIDSCCALLMEEAQMDLFDMVEKCYYPNKRKMITKVIDMYRQIAQGLDHIHSFNYSHNDIKSENILIFKNLSEAKITDFGLANDTKVYEKLTKSEIINSQVQQWEYRCLNHAAPEIINMLKTKSSCFDEQKADVFAFGVSFFESIFGFRPFIQYALSSDPIYKNFANKQTFTRFWKTNPQIQQVLKEINNGDIDINKLFDVIFNTLRKNPNDRISSAELLIHPLFD